MNQRRQQICLYHLENRCRYGNACNFSHDTSPLSFSFSSNNRNHRPVCRNYTEGRCRFGRNCKYFHPLGSQQHHQQPRQSNSRCQPSLHIQSRSIEISFPAISTFKLSPDAAPFVPQHQANVDDVATEEQQQSNLAENPFCPYFEETGECSLHNQGVCPLVHGNYCELCCRYCLDSSNQEQQRTHVQKCVEEHERQMKIAFANQLSKEKTCGICMENIWEQAQRFGILNNCKHCYCLRCIRAWRKTTGPVQREATRSCPQCRVVSDFVIPSEQWIEEKTEKDALIRQYQTNMKQKTCKYVKNDSADDCPFGNKCFYRHQRRDGTIIQSGPPRRRRRSTIDYQNLSIEDFVSLVPNISLVRVGAGEGDGVGFLFSEFQDLFEFDLPPFYSYNISSDEDERDIPTDDDLEGLDEELFELRVNRVELSDSQDDD